MSKEPVTLDNCADEPIHIPGAIQPHGVLFSCSGADGTVLQVSANVGEHFEGVSAEALLGRPLSELFDPTSGDVLRSISLEADPRVESPFRLVRADGEPFDAVAHRSGERLIIEIEPAVARRTALVGGFDPRLRSSVRRMHGAQTVDALCTVAAEEVRRLIGFDRVMVYRFDPDWNGRVVAESARAGIGSFLGQRFPASDIPAQARRLYTQNRLRLIADARYTAVPLVPPLDPETRAPLDMSDAMLRSVSPIHLEYLTNMGVRASMSISLIVDGELAGLIACHHYEGARHVGVVVRDTAEYLGAALSWQLKVLESAEQARRARGTQRHEAEVVRSAAVAPELLDGLDVPALVELTNARGAAVVLDEGTRRIGETPSSKHVAAVVAWLHGRGDEIFVTDRLANDMPEAAAFEDTGAGLVAVAVSEGEYLMWFRPAITREIEWAGNPTKEVTTDASGVSRLSPRGSFALYVETVRGRSQPWEPWEIEAASSLRRLLLGGVRRRAKELRSFNHRLLEADRAKDQFIATVSHELRAPLNAISGWASLLQARSVPEDRIEHAIGVISRNAQVQARLIEDLLDMSRMTGGQMGLDLSDLDLGALVESTLDGLRPAVDAKSLRLTVELSPEARAVRGDVVRLRQIVVNLVGNATKFTDKQGAVHVALRREASDVVLEVKDDGRGIAPEFLPHVFEPFRQEGVAPSKRSGGLGLGLAIVKKLVELHGGRIWVESEGRGHGTSFFVRLPVAATALSRASDVTIGPRTLPVPDNLAGVRVLLVDDDADGREVVRRLLVEAGALVVGVPSASAALHALSSGAFDILLSDVGMPEVDGLALIRKVRARSSETGGSIPAVALTAHARTADRVAALQAGFNAYVAKPVHPDELLATLSSALLPA